MNNSSILVVDDETDIRLLIQEILSWINQRICTRSRDEA